MPVWGIPSIHNLFFDNLPTAERLFLPQALY